MVEMVRDGRDGRDGPMSRCPRWSEMVRDGPRWSRWSEMVRDGRDVEMVRDGQMVRWSGRTGAGVGSKRTTSREVAVPEQTLSIERTRTQP